MCGRTQHHQTRLSCSIGCISRRETTRASGRAEAGGKAQCVVEGVHTSASMFGRVCHHTAVFHGHAAHDRRDASYYPLPALPVLPHPHPHTEERWRAGGAERIMSAVHPRSRHRSTSARSLSSVKGVEWLRLRYLVPHYIRKGADAPPTLPSLLSLRPCVVHTGAPACVCVFRGITDAQPATFRFHFPHTQALSKETRMTEPPCVHLLTASPTPPPRGCGGDSRIHTRTCTS